MHGLVGAPRPSRRGIGVTVLVVGGVPSVLIALVVNSILLSVPAGAGATGTDGPGGNVSVGASGGSWRPGGPGSSGSGGSEPGSGAGHPWVCTDTPLQLNDESQAPGGPLPGGWFSITCADLATGALVTETEWITQAEGGSTAPAVDPLALALQAERSLRLPAPQISFSPSGSALVNLPTWLWVNASMWHPESVTATAAGVSATAVAAPTSVSWSMGDGGTVVCDGPGVPYDPSEPASTQATSCDHTYLESSAGEPSPSGDPDDGSFPVTATVDWTVSWTAAGAAGGGPLPGLTTATRVPERVEQVESVNTLNGLDVAPGGAL